MILKKNLFLLLAISLVFTSCKVRKQYIVDNPPSEIINIKKTTVSDITEDDIYWHISALASDSMQGRKMGTPYEALAAEYIKEEFKSLGLKAFEDNYLQEVPVYSRSSFTGCELFFDDYKGEYPTDFRSMIMFDSLTVSGEAVFAGYGFDSDYENLDVKDKWVMIAEDNNSILYERKANAKDKGASGVLVIGKDGTTGDERYVLPSDSMPMIKISYQLSDRLLAHAGMTVREVLEKVKSGEKQSITIPVVVNATIKSATQWVSSHNVVACLEVDDSDSENEYIVVGGHFDHIGTKTDGDSMLICNGADDNASGVAGVLELAEKLSVGEKLRYNVIFAAFGAEEIGLVGSRYFCNNPPVPIEKIKLMVNLDMIGRMDSDNHVFINTSKSNDRFNDVLDEIKNSHPDINATPSYENYMQGSDHTSFFNKNIPVIFFTTGLHPDYHTPTDTIGSINYRGEKLLLDFVYDFIMKEAGRIN